MSAQIASILTEDGGFPNDEIFNCLLPLARSTKRTVIRDPSVPLEAGYDQLLTDVIHVRHMLRQRLSPHFNCGARLLPANSLVPIMSPANYEFAVAALAILSIGGTIVPLPNKCTAEMLSDILLTSPTKLVLASQNEVSRAIEFQALCKAAVKPAAIEVGTITVQNHCPAAIWNLPFEIDKHLTIAASRPGIIFFSSGSTGTPKGIIHSRAILHGNQPASEDEALLICRPASWIAGSKPLLQCVLSGARAEIVSPDADAKTVWELFRARRLTAVGGTVILWHRLAQTYRETIANLPNKAEYLQGVRSIRDPVIGGSVPPSSLLKFWKHELQSPLATRYGSSEISLAVLGTHANDDLLERCMGKSLSPEYPVRLSNGDHGELLVKGLKTFQGYLNHEGATTDMFDRDGYYKTGDIAHRVGEYYIFDGRASMDFIKVIGDPVPIQVVEQALNSLPSVVHAVVVPVEDEDVGRRVGVIGHFRSPVTLHSLRQDLSPHLPPRMLPTAFRLLSDKEKLPMTFSEKIAKRDVLKKFFPFTVGIGLPSEVELCEQTVEACAP